MVDLAQSVVKAIAKNLSKWFSKEEDIQTALFGTLRAVRHTFAKGLLDVLQGESDHEVME